MKKVAIKSYHFVVRNFNVSRIICNHLFTEKHSEKHRMVVGIIIISIGVMINNVEVHIILVKYMLEGVGNSIHAIGFAPFIEKFLRLGKENEIDKTEK